MTQSSVTSIGDSAFSDCDSLTSVRIGNSVTSIGSDAFCGCTGLTSATIPSGVTSIGKNAFYECSSLTSITIGNSVASIGSWAFYNTGFYKNDSNWESNVLYIGDYLIEAKSSLSGEYIVKNGTKCIAGSAFYSCDSLTSVTIPNSVTSIGKYAFDECSSLTNVYYAGSEADWNNIQIGDGNNYLTDAKRTYITKTEKSTKTTPSADGKSFAVKPENIANGNVIVIALYDGNKIIDTQSAVYGGSDVTFNTGKDYTAAKVMVWESMSNVAPVCDVEIVK